MPSNEEGRVSQLDQLRCLHSLRTLSHKVDTFLFRAVCSRLHCGFDFHVDTSSHTSAHRVEVELARRRVTANGAPSIGATDMAFSESKRRKKLLHPASQAALVDTTYRLHFFCGRCKQSK